MAMVKLFREFGDSRKGKRKTALLCGKLGKKGENQRNKECGFSFCRSSSVLAFPDNILQRVREEKWLLKNQSVRRKSVDLSKLVLLDVETTFRSTFPSSNLRCLQRGDPENLCANTRIRLHYASEYHYVSRV